MHKDDVIILRWFVAEQLGNNREMIGERSRRASEGLAVFCFFAWEVAANTSYKKRFIKYFTPGRGREESKEEDEKKWEEKRKGSKGKERRRKGKRKEGREEGKEREGQERKEEVNQEDEDFQHFYIRGSVYQDNPQFR